MRHTICALLLAAALPALSDDLTILSRVTRDGGPPQTSANYISSDHVRIAQGDGKEMILDLRTGDVTTLDNAKKTYYVMTRQDFEAMNAKIQEQMNSPEMKKAQEHMNNLPPEQRAQMEKMMGGMFTVTVEKSGTSRKIAGYDCENWTIAIGQFSKSEECVTSQLKYPAAAWDAYKGFADSMKSMMAAMGPMAKGAMKMQEQFKKMKGFPLANTTSTDIMGHRSVIATEVTSVKYGPIPPSAFAIPAGYTKVDNPMLKAMDRMGKHR
jgi:PHD/YefM family antitoxin component YafN of YafNO toxin-antitoxin module